MQQILSARGCRVHCRGPEVHADLIDESFDVGVIAVKKTGSWTADLIVALRAAPLACAVVTVLDVGARHEVSESLRYGAVDCIMRPFAPAQFFECIDHAVASTYRWRACLAAPCGPESGTRCSVEGARSQVFEPRGQVAVAPAGESDEQRVERMVERLAHEHQLTRREREVLYCLVQGHRYDDIATMLGVVLRTVKFHAANLLRKLELDSRHDLPRLLVLEA